MADSRVKFNIEPEDVAPIRSRELLTKLKPEDLDLILREKAAGLRCGVFYWCSQNSM